MSKKSHPGDGSANQGIKGGMMYGASFAVNGAPEKASFVASLIRLLRGLRAG